MCDKLAPEDRQPPASPDAIAACESALGVVFPGDLKAFLLASNGYNGDVGAHYLVLWSVDEIAAGAGYDSFPVSQNRFLIGSNGGPTAFAVFDGRYVSVPFAISGPIEDEMRLLGNDFVAFLEAIARGEGW